MIFTLILIHNVLPIYSDKVEKEAIVKPFFTSTFQRSICA